jgi:hypothetical protein
MFARQQQLTARSGSARHACALLPCTTAAPRLIAGGAAQKPSCNKQLDCLRAVVDQAGTADSATAHVRTRRALRVLQQQQQSAVSVLSVSATSQHCRNVLLLVDSDRARSYLAFATATCLQHDRWHQDCPGVGSACVCAAQHFTCLAGIDMVNTAQAAPHSCGTADLHACSLASANGSSRPAAAAAGRGGSAASCQSSWLMSCTLSMAAWASQETSL